VTEAKTERGEPGKKARARSPAPTTSCLLFRRFRSWDEGRDPAPYVPPRLEAPPTSRTCSVGGSSFQRPRGGRSDPQTRWWRSSRPDDELSVLRHAPRGRSSRSGDGRPSSHGARTWPDAEIRSGRSRTTLPDAASQPGRRPRSTRAPRATPGPETAGRIADTIAPPPRGDARRPRAGLAVWPTGASRPARQRDSPDGPGAVAPRRTGVTSFRAFRRPVLAEGRRARRSASESTDRRAGKPTGVARDDRAQGEGPRVSRS